jgi:hypothetical protein
LRRYRRTAGYILRSARELRCTGAATMPNAAHGGQLGRGAVDHPVLMGRRISPAGKCGRSIVSLADGA